VSNDEPKPCPMMCERSGCDKRAYYDCEPIPGIAEPGWENEPTARCEEHAKGLLIPGKVPHDRRDPGAKY
jgi:hypothetical protein